MSDHYYYKSHLYNTMQNLARLTCMKKIRHYDEITNWDKEVINKENHIFKEDDIKKMFESFRENNFRESPVREFVLGNEI